MSKSKITIIVASCILMLGIVLCGVGYCLGGVNSFLKGGAFMDSNYEEKVFEAPASQVDSIKISDRNNNVILRPSSDDMVRVYYHISDKLPFEVKLDGGELVGKRGDLRKWYNYIGLNFSLRAYTTIIEIPDGFSGSLMLRTSNASIVASDVDVTGALSLITSNAKITTENVQVRDTLSADTSNAAIIAERVTARELVCNTSNGSIRTNATVNERVYLDTSNATIRLDLYGGADSITANSSNGDIEGRIHADIGDYRITVKTSNGDCNLNNTTRGDKTLKLTTSNADIDVLVEP